MKTLIINGSTNPHGDTAALLAALTERLQGEVQTLSCADAIRPCCDCRRCWQSAGCSIPDAMQAFYPYLLVCDSIVLASPIWFSSLSGPLLTIASRLQTLFAASFFRREKLAMQPKRGAILLAGAQKGTEAAPLATARILLKNLQIRPDELAVVCSMDTDRLPAAQDMRALQAAREAADWLNRTGSLSAGT